MALKDLNKRGTDQSFEFVRVIAAPDAQIDLRAMMRSSGRGGRKE